VPALNRVARGERERDLVPISWSQNGKKVASILVFVERLRGHLAIRLSYTVTIGGEKVDRNYPVLMSTTPSNLPSNAGWRWWFVCPLTVNGQSCFRRVGVLYSHSGWFGCRHCHNLTYRSCKESDSRVSRLASGLLDLNQLRDGNFSDMLLALKAWDKIEKKHKREIDRVMRELRKRRRRPAGGM
jgi:hypothetical protein